MLACPIVRRVGIVWRPLLLLLGVVEPGVDGVVLIGIRAAAGAPRSKSSGTRLVVCPSYAGHQGFIGSVMQVFRLFAHAVSAGVLQTTLDTSVARSLISCIELELSDVSNGIFWVDETYRKLDERAGRQNRLS